MLTDKQEKILSIIKEYLSENGYSPSIRELCNLSGLSSTSSVHNHLTKLCEKGYITYSHDKKRSIQICNFQSYENVPVMGVITAGTPIIAEQNIESYLPVSNELIRGRDVFCLKIKGDSMINAGIFDNDTVIIAKQQTVDNGEIAAVLIDDSATVKRFYKKDKNVILQPENENYQPIVCENATILGKVIGVYREII